MNASLSNRKLSTYWDYRPKESEGAMRIPDETHYKKGETRIEDRPGYVLCTACMNCPIVDRFQIYDDGYFKCAWSKEWRRGDDILEYKCKGYHPKLCSNCKKRCKCPDYLNVKDSISFCRKYKRLSGNMYFGRRKLRSHNPRILEMEAFYNERKRKRLEADNQGHRSKTQGDRG